VKWDGRLPIGHFAALIMPASQSSDPSTAVFFLFFKIFPFAFREQKSNIQYMYDQVNNSSYARIVHEQKSGIIDGQTIESNKQGRFAGNSNLLRVRQVVTAIELYTRAHDAFTCPNSKLDYRK
jgi:hypothetical protein